MVVLPLYVLLGFVLYESVWKGGGLAPAVLGFSVMDRPGSRNLTGAITPPSPCRGAEDCCAARQSSEYEYQYLTSTTDNCKT
jgi:hypothetical protein